MYQSSILKCKTNFCKFKYFLQIHKYLIFKNKRIVILLKYFLQFLDIWTIMMYLYATFEISYTTKLTMYTHNFTSKEVFFLRLGLRYTFLVFIYGFKNHPFSIFIFFEFRNQPFSII